MRCNICKKEFSYERALTHHLKKAHASGEYKATVENWFEHNSSSEDDIEELMIDMIMRVPLLRS
jgi:hypothetical protein